MYSSLKEWCVFPFYVHAYDGLSGSGDKRYKTPVEHQCYRVDDAVQITDKYGRQYASQTVLYLPAEVSLTVDDMISFPGKTTRYEIHKLGGYYDSGTGLDDIIVVYL